MCDCDSVQTKWIYDLACWCFPTALESIPTEARWRDISQYGSTVVDTLPQFMHVTSDCIAPVKMRWIIQSQSPTAVDIHGTDTRVRVYTSVA